MTTRKPKPDEPLELLLSSKQVAGLLGITTKTLHHWEVLGRVD